MKDMADEKSPVELLLDENNNDNIKLYDEENNCVEFEQIATIPMDEKIYVILKPVAPMENVAEDEALNDCRSSIPSPTPIYFTGIP